MKLLLHVCCAPCSVKCIEILRNDKIEPVLYWYNPNIHPYTEYKSRKDALKIYADKLGLKLILKDEYGLKKFLTEAAADLNFRCSGCYRMRLDETARYAAQNGYESFSTTLLISPYQKHDLIKETAKNSAAKYNIDFFYKDFKPYFKEGQTQAKKESLYMQKYCGCIFSEEERYLK